MARNSYTVSMENILRMLQAEFEDKVLTANQLKSKLNSDIIATIDEENKHWNVKVITFRYKGEIFATYAERWNTDLYFKNKLIFIPDIVSKISEKDFSLLKLRVE